jgi:dynein heavy chain 1
MNLAQCRQNQDIPNVDFPIEPIIKARIESARERKQICNINEFDDIAQDKYFLNSLNNYVNNWYRDIRKVTGLDHAIESGNALQEINFWQQMEQRLTTIKEKQGSEEVLMTLNILSQAKRYMTVMTFQHDTDIDPKLKTAKDYNKLLKEIPILSLYDALTLQQIDSSIKGIFAQLKKMKYMGTSYPLERALDLSESIARDFDAQLKKVISSIQIMQMEYREFSKINTQEIMEVQKTWSACIDDLK